jgi:hypothetical protein
VSGARSVSGGPGGALRLNLASVLAIVLLLAGVVPAALVVAESDRDPLQLALASLALPAWAAGSPQDVAAGSRWCVRQCRSRERTWSSQRPVRDTAAAFADALHDAGWRPYRQAGCPLVATPNAGGCWQRDEYVLNLFVRTPTCDGQPNQAPATDAGPPPGGAVAPPTRGAGTCPPAQATVKVFNRVAFGDGPA